MNDQLTHTRKNIQNYTENQTGRIRKKSAFPKWLRKPILLSGKRREVEKYLRQDNLYTVCEEAKCPNRNECFANGTATFLIMGDICTRNCLFCNIKHGTPQPLDPHEPGRLVNAVKKMRLSYVVITTVTRDDLLDGGADHIAKTISLLKRNIRGIKVEVLVPDFNGNMTPVLTLLSNQPDVFSHNIETVPSIFPGIRPDANYAVSLQLLGNAAENSTNISIKSGFMVGLGETENEAISLMEDLRKSQVSILTIGQYLQPTKNQVKVKEVITPAQFERYKNIGNELGFSRVFSGPFIRSSYRAAEVFANEQQQILLSKTSQIK